MEWVKHIVKGIVIFAVLWVLGYLYGAFVLDGNVVPVDGVEVDEWMASYYLALGVSAILGFICTMVWVYMGRSYAGEAGITAKYYVLWFVSLVLGVIAAYFVIPSAQDGAGASFAVVALLAPIGFYTNACLHSPEAVKYIPLFCTKFHK